MVIKSFKLYFDNDIHNLWRVVTKKKCDLLTTFWLKYKQYTNYIFKTFYNDYKELKNVSYDDKRKRFEWEFKETFTSWYAQNTYKFAKDSYIHTVKSFFSKEKWTKLKSKKKVFKKPYQQEIKGFPIDNRMLSSKPLLKDKNIDNLYWLSILNPFRKDNTDWVNYKGRINIPLYFYDEVIDLMSKWYKYSFILHNKYIEIVFKYELDIKIINIEQEIDSLSSELNKHTEKLSKCGIDFWKNMGVYDGKNTILFNLHKMYRNIDNKMKDIGKIQKELQILKKKRILRPLQ